MTELDLGIAGFVVLGALVGAWVGAVRQVVTSLAWVAAAAAVYFGATPLAHLLAEPLGAGFALAYLFGAASLAVVTWVAVRVLLWLPTRRKKHKDDADPLTASDRLAGAIVGAAKLGLLAWVALSVVAVLASPYEARGMQLRFADASFYQVARANNFVSMVFERRLAAVERALEHLASGAKTTPELEALARDARLQAVAKDAAIRRQLEHADACALARSSPLFALVTDAGAMERFVSVTDALGPAPEPPAPRHRRPAVAVTLPDGGVEFVLATDGGTLEGDTRTAQAADAGVVENALAPARDAGR